MSSLPSQTAAARNWQIKPEFYVTLWNIFLGSSACFYDKEPHKCLHRHQGRERLIFSPLISNKWVTPFLSCSTDSWQLALSKIHLFLWRWKAMTSPSSKDSQKNEKPTWFLLPRAHCLYSPFSVLRKNTDFYPCLIRTCRGLQADGSCQAPDFFNPSFLFRGIGNMSALLTDFFFAQWLLIWKFIHSNRLFSVKSVNFMVIYK